MSISANFPHQLALLVIALQTDKLPICEHLEDPTEKSLVASLMTYMNNRDFRTPITIARKTLGEQIRVKRSTLFTKLRSLKEKGLLQDVTGEKPIRFTDKAIALMQLEWTKQADRWKEKNKGGKERTPNFKVGRSSFPADLVPLINRGITGSQMRGLMCEAKKAGRKLQTVLQQFEEVLSKYEGKVLFLVTRSILRNPDKYLKSAKNANFGLSLASHDHQMLASAADNANCILHASEQLKLIDNVWHFADAKTEGMLKPITLEAVAALRARMRDLVSAYVSAHPDFVVRHDAALGISSYVDLDASNDTLCAYRTIHHRSGEQKTLMAPWHAAYSALPYAARTILQDGPVRDRRIGKLLIFRGIRYLVDTIDNTVAMLRVLTGKNAGRYCNLPVHELNNPEVQWERS